MCGVSYPAFLKTHYAQAVQAVHLGKLLSHDRTLFEYEEYEIYHLLRIGGDKTDLKDFATPTCKCFWNMIV